MWKAPLDVHGVHPRPMPVRIGRKVDQCALIEHHRIGYARAMDCYPFERRPGRSNSPDVPVIGRHAANKINERSVGRPHRKMAMHPRRCHINPTVRAVPGLSWLPHEQWIAWRGRVIYEPVAIARPIELGGLP